MTKPTPEEPAWNVYKATCPTRQVLACIADKWAVLLIGALIEGTRRSGELRAISSNATAWSSARFSPACRHASNIH